MKSNHPKKPFLIGRYQLGWRMVKLWAVPEMTGANFNLCFKGQEAKIECGMNYNDLAEAFGILCHEVWEMAMDDALCCYRPKAFQETASDVYHFFFNHNQHTEICAKASFFIWSCFEDFRKAHKRCRRSR